MTGESQDRTSALRLEAQSVEARGLVKSYGRSPVLRGVDITVPAGETMVVIGASGSGKSTLLRVLIGLESAKTGYVEIGGDKFISFKHGKLVKENAYNTKRYLLGMVFQRFTMLEQLTVAQNVMLGPRKVLGMDADEARQIATESLARVGLADKLDAYPGHLSGGQQQRTAIARELAMNRKVILFDEVTSALDPELVQEVLAVMRELAQGGMSMIVVTHEIGFARHVAHRMMFMSNGLVEEEGPPEQLVEAPESERTRRFLGKVLS